MELAPITLISGSPGAGKTTLARRLADERERGVHIVTDKFFGYVRRVIDPSTAAAREQNETVVRAYMRAAVAFAEGGYEVFLDGVIGPWMLDTVNEAAGEVPLNYVVLRADLESVVGRAAERTMQEAATEDVVRHMHAQFADLDEYEGHVIETTGLRVEDVVTEYRRRAALGDFRLA